MCDITFPLFNNGENFQPVLAHLFLTIIEGNLPWFVCQNDFNIHVSCSCIKREDTSLAFMTMIRLAVKDELCNS